MSNDLHDCPAAGCDVTNLPARLLACQDHWWMLPDTLRKRILYAYRQGRRQQKHPTGLYLQAVLDACDYWDEHAQVLGS